MRCRGLSAILLTAAACSRGPPSGASPQGDVADAVPAARGAQLYQQNCAPCHQDDAHGIVGLYPSLAGSAVACGDPVALARWVLKGVRPASLPAGRYATQMLRFGWMKDTDAAALLSYLRDNFGNHAPAIDEASIARARDAE